LGNQKEIESAIEVILDRVKYAFEGVPPETRKALENGNTEFLRELHGGARLYPDTDSQPIINSGKEIKKLSSEVPEYPWDIIQSYSKKYDTEKRIIKELIFNNQLSLFNELIEIYPKDPTLIFTTLLETTTALQRDGKDMEQIQEEDFIRIFELLDQKEIGKEAIERILEYKAENPQLSIQEVKEDLDLESVDREELKEILTDVVDNNVDLIKERQMGAMGPLMGDAMKELRGKIDGSIISEELQTLIKTKLKELSDT
jgi:glutamyl-tRNA(Gln) amidotransferase subunit E